MTKAEITKFIAKSLSISVSSKNLGEIQQVLKSKEIDWDLYVKISTSQLVLPALYCNYKRNNLIQFLPDDLVAYMEEITSLNRDRNLQIIEQIHELNTLLRDNGVNPIFTKGASYLSQGLYEDPAERMVGDIDFLLSSEEYHKSIELLINNGYELLKNSEYLRPYHRHFSRLVKNDKIAAVEIHREMIIEKYASEFNYKVIKNNIIQNNGFSVLSYNDQKALSIFSNQINDNGYDYKSMGLKNAYDFLLLNSKKPGTEFALYFNKLKTPIHCFLASVDFLFEDLGLVFDNNKKVQKYLKEFKELIKNPKKRKFVIKITRLRIFLIYRTKIILRCFVNKEYRVWLFRRISDKRWQREKLVKLGLRKPIDSQP